MAEVGVAAAAVLAAILAWAGGVKLARRRATAAAFAALGVPRPSVLAAVVPILEVAVGAALLAAPRIGGVAALGLLAAFTTVVVRRWRSGEAAPCACFGTARAEPVSFVEVVRNALLACLATAALFAPRPEAPSLAAVVLVSAGVIAGVVVLALCALRRDVGSVWDNSLGREARPGGRP